MFQELVGKEISMGRIENVSVFEDTSKLVKKNEVIKESVQRSTAGQKLILESDVVFEPNKERYSEEAK